MKNVLDLFHRCCDKLESIGLAIDKRRIGAVCVSSRMTKSFGICTSRKLWDGKYCSEIKISNRVLDDSVPDWSAENVMLHELLHARHPGDHHGGAWAREAKIVSSKLGYDITRTSSCDALGVEAAKPKYEVRCPKCGKIFTRQRLCGLVQHPSLYTHEGCGVALERVAKGNLI
jgi:predicted RNA-binding Zn-ribbon protein involved in translation (DUF1610 family)